MVYNPRYKNEVLESFPPQVEVEKRVLVELRLRGRPVAPSELYGPLADQFGLSVSQRHAPRPTQPDSSDPAWHNHVRYARRRLVDIGLMNRMPRNMWSLTARGLEAAARLEGGGPMIETLTLADLGLD